MAAVFDSTEDDGEIHLADEETGALVSIRPDRGAIVARFDVGEDQVLYMDKETLADRSKNVRGGIPVLFPSPGKLAGDAWAWGGRRGAMKQHGFARNLAFRETGRLEGATASLALRLDANDETRAQFPWAFSLELTFVLSGSRLRIHQRVTNRDATPMPFGLGFHPYFRVPDADKKAAVIETRARRAFDNVTKTTVDLDGIDLTRKEVDLHLLDHASTDRGSATECVMRWRTGRVHLRGSKELTRWVVWTLAGRDFVCLEPWTCPGDALNSAPDRLLVLAPSETRSLELDLDYTPRS